jgi:hypothetical protein
MPQLAELHDLRCNPGSLSKPALASKVSNVLPVAPAVVLPLTFPHRQKLHRGDGGNRWIIVSNHIRELELASP